MVFLLKEDWDKDRNIHQTSALTESPSVFGHIYCLLKWFWTKDDVQQTLFTLFPNFLYEFRSVHHCILLFRQWSLDTSTYIGEKLIRIFWYIHELQPLKELPIFAWNFYSYVLTVQEKLHQFKTTYLNRFISYFVCLSLQRATSYISLREI